MACTLAPSAALLGFNTAAFLDRRHGVAALAPAAARSVMARDRAARRVGVVKRSLDGKIRDREGFAAGEMPVIATPEQQRLQQRMRAELDAIRVLHRKALLLSRGAAPASKDGARLSAAGARAAMGRKTSNPAPAAAQKSTEQVMMKQQQKRPVQTATPPSTKLSVAEAVEKARDVLKRRRLEEVAQARENCRQDLLEMERMALPDETIYEKDLLELGIAFQYAVTRTRSQAVLSG